MVDIDVCSVCSFGEANIMLRCGRKALAGWSTPDWGRDRMEGILLVLFC